MVGGESLMLEERGNVLNLGLGGEKKGIGDDGGW